MVIKCLLVARTRKFAVKAASRIRSSCLYCLFRMWVKNAEPVFDLSKLSKRQTEISWSSWKKACVQSFEKPVEWALFRDRFTESTHEVLTLYLSNAASGGKLWSEPDSRLRDVAAVDGCTESTFAKSSKPLSSTLGTAWDVLFFTC